MDENNANRNLLDRLAGALEAIGVRAGDEGEPADTAEPKC